MTPFRAILEMQWARARIVVILCALIAFGLPAYIAGQRYVDTGGWYGNWTFWLETGEMLGRGFPLLALGLGLGLGVLSWSDDQRMGHVYALTLPQSRERYVLMRFAAGGLLMLIPVAALLLGASVAAAVVELPPGVNAYPVALSTRFGLATLTCYTVFFALAVATRRAARLMALVLVLLVVGELALMMFGGSFSLFDSVLAGITRWPSPFVLLTGRWALFDV
jgi:hypothetical protein